MIGFAVLIVLLGAVATGLVLVRDRKRSSREISTLLAAVAEHEKLVSHYRVMAEEASDIIMLFENNRIVCASRALDRILGCKPEAIQDGHYLELVHPDDLDEARKLRGQPKPGEIWTATYRARHADGHYVWLEAMTRGADDDGSGLPREITVTREVTERKEQELKMRAAQERAEAANKAKSQFLATMSHELRTPLNAILGFSDILMGGKVFPMGDARARDYAEYIHNSGVHLLGLINDILDITKLDDGKLVLHPEPVELAGLIAECVRTVEPQAVKCGVRVHTDLDTNIREFQADKKRLRQMLLNLLSNAIKFTPEGGEVRISTRALKSAVAIKVADTGIGIEAEAIPKALERFGQIDSTLARKYEGTGLGLPLTKQLAELHGAAFSIESHVGKGTAVTLTFPTGKSAKGRQVA